MQKDLESVTDPVPPAGQLRISIVVPVRNEEGNIAPLVRDIENACTDLGAFELIYVDDGSSDGTTAALAGLSATRPWLRPRA